MKINFLLLKLLLIFEVSITFISCTTFEEPKKDFLSVHDEVEWNYLLYMAADNNLERFALRNIAELKSSLSTDRINVIVLFDRSPGYDKTAGNWTDTRLFRLSGSSSLDDDFIKSLGELDMTLPETLSMFLAIADEYFPAKRTILNIWSHAKGVYSDCTIPFKADVRSLIADYTTSYSAQMSVKDFCDVLEKYVLKKEKKIEILQFDCCLMQMLEVLYELKDSVSYVAGSQTELAGDGSNYKEIIDFIQNNPKADTAIIATEIIKSFKEKYDTSVFSQSFSVADMNYINEFILEFNIFLSQIMKEISNAELTELRTNVFSYSNTYIEYIDLYDFMTSISSKLENENNIDKLCIAFQKLIPQNYSSNVYQDKLHGIGINIPYTTKLLSFYKNEKYNDFMKIYADTNLSQFISFLSSDH